MTQKIYFSSADWHNRIGAIIRHIDSPDFGNILSEAINQIVPVEQLAIIAYVKNTAPTFQFYATKESQRQSVIELYVEGAYLLDPWYHAAQHNMKAGLYLLQDVAPDDFFSSEFYNTYYKATKLTNEIVYVVQIPGDATLNISLGLTTSHISAKDMENLHTIAPVITEAACRHWKGVTTESTKQAIIHEQVSNTFEKFGHSVLSQREREVVLLILRGHSLKTTSELLGIAFGTVKVHTKNLYQKLSITSQAELFSLFIDSLTSQESSGEGDQLQS